MERRARLDDHELTHGRGVLAELGLTGAAIYSTDAIAKGDTVQVGWAWCRVVRVSKRTVTVDHLHQPGWWCETQAIQIHQSVCGSVTPLQLTAVARGPKGD